MSGDDSKAAELPAVATLATTGRSALILRGADNQRFLHGLVTFEVKGLAPGDGAYGFVTTAKGKIQADAVLNHRGDDLLLALPEGLREEIAEHLTKYVIVDRVEILPYEGTAVVLAGDGSREWLAQRAEGADLSAVPRWGGLRLEIDGRQLWAGREELLGVEAWTLWADDGVLPTELPPTADPQVEDAWRVAQGLPRFGRDFDTAHFPQETGLDEAVSYTKGCYLGQEVIARIHYRGGVQRQIRRLEAPTGGLVEGQSLELDGKKMAIVGTVGSGGRAALAMVRRKAWDEGVVLTADSVEARVVP
ncbi:MAG: hypothetical protein AAF604_02375 [Acidobacteriota bacterium]